MISARHWLLFNLRALALLVLAPAMALANSHLHEATVYTKQGERTYTLETATTEKTRAIGLMNRDSLAPAEGMLFLFSKPDRYAFWMKNTRIPLDMIFIDDAHSIIHIERNTTPHSLTQIRPPSPIISVIELDGGRAARDGIAVGDNVRYALPAQLTVD